MPVKIFRLKDSDKIDKILNQWEEDNKFKINNVNICPIKWYSSKDLTRISDSDLLVTVIYHKKRMRKDVNNVNDK